MKLFSLTTLGVRLTAVAIIAMALILGGSAAVSQKGSGAKRTVETRADAQYTTTTTTAVKRSFEQLVLAPGAAGIALGLLPILANRPVARILILGVRG